MGHSTPNDGMPRLPRLHRGRPPEDARARRAQQADQETTLKIVLDAGEIREVGS
jgi:hypothetical protein